MKARRILVSRWGEGGESKGILVSGGGGGKQWEY